MQEDAIICCLVGEVTLCSNQDWRVMACSCWLFIPLFPSGEVSFPLNKKLHAWYYSGLLVDKWPLDINSSNPPAWSCVTHWTLCRGQFSDWQLSKAVGVKGEVFLLFLLREALKHFRSSLRLLFNSKGWTCRVHLNSHVTKSPSCDLDIKKCSIFFVSLEIHINQRCSRLAHSRNLYSKLTFHFLKMSPQLVYCLFIFFFWSKIETVHFWPGKPPPPPPTYVITGFLLLAAPLSCPSHSFSCLAPFLPERGHPGPLPGVQPWIGDTLIYQSSKKNK